jgi:hypothetical protein
MEDGFEFVSEEYFQQRGISRMQAVQVVQSAESRYFPLSRREGRDRLMFVGFAQGRIDLLEAGVELAIADGQDKIFHVNKARKYFQKLYNEEMQVHD